MDDSTPICRCRVLYLGSAVPRQSKDGLQGIQEPLRTLYPSEAATGSKGIDSWLSVWSNGILLENMNDSFKQVTRFFPISSLHYCAAVRQVLIPEHSTTSQEPKFLPLDSPFARAPCNNYPPVFAAILRRTSGIKVLECHIFVCKREAAANALVRCCFHAYADNSYVRQLESKSKSNNKGCDTPRVNTSSYEGHVDPTFRCEHIAHGKRSNSQTLQENTLDLRNIDSQISDLSAIHKLTATANVGINCFKTDGDSIATTDDTEKVDSDIDNKNCRTRNGSDSIYEGYGSGSSTLGRHIRARQVVASTSVPPPPIGNDNDIKAVSRKCSNGRQNLPETLVKSISNRPPIFLSGSFNVNAGKKLYRNCGHYLPRQYHTISHRHLPSRIANFSHAPYSGGILQPANLPTPLRSANPISHTQQYATLQSTRKFSHYRKINTNESGMLVCVPNVSFSLPYISPPAAEYQPLSMFARRLARSFSNGLDDSGNSESESIRDAGIYKRKGHLNERAFSYSIRQERRSRSHGSLSNIQFNPPDLKKEREIAQIVADLSLNDEKCVDNPLSLSATHCKE